MKERILKRLSLINVKMLQQEKLIRYFVDNEGELIEDSSKAIANRNNLTSQIEFYKKKLQEVK